MSKLITQTPDYSIADGNTTFDSVQAESDKLNIQVHYEDVDADDVKLSLEQSLTATFDDVENSEQLVDKSADSHTYNMINTKPGQFVRVKLEKGSAIAGTITKINYLV